MKSIIMLRQRDRRNILSLTCSIPYIKPCACFPTTRSFTPPFMPADTPEEQAVQTCAELSEMLSSVIYPTEAIAAVHIIGDADWKFFSSEPGVNEQVLRQTCDALLNDAQSRKSYAFTDVVNMDYGAGKRQRVVQYITPINKLANAGRLGYMVVDIDCVILEETFLFASYKSDDMAMITQQNGNILFNFP